jgi:hypothetical protein
MVLVIAVGHYGTEDQMRKIICNTNGIITVRNVLEMLPQKMLVQGAFYNSACKT